MRLRAVALVGLALALALLLGYTLARRGREGVHAGSVAGLVEPRSPYSQQPIVVDVFEYGFQPARVVIRAGQTVAWKNVGKQFHVVVPDSRRGRRIWAEANDEGSAAHLFRKPGRYPYHCSIHPQMRAVVVVRPKTSR